MAQANRFFSIGQLGEMPPPKWLIEDMFEANTLVMVAGPAGSYKSFLVLDWIMCMASGKDWNKRKTEQNKVLYVLGEGRSSLLKRIQTWTHCNKLCSAELKKLEQNFKVTFDVPQMAHRASVDNLLQSLSGEDFAPQVIVIDTFARSFVGMDENSQKDTGLWIESADRLRAAGFTVIFLHHTAKNTEFGVKYRGSTAIMGAMDTAMTMTRFAQIPNGAKLEVTKQKDHDEGAPLYFTKRIVTPPGALDSSIILEPTTWTEGDEQGAAGEVVKPAPPPKDIVVSYIEQLVKEPISERAQAVKLSHMTGGTLQEEAAKQRIRRWKESRMIIDAAYNQKPVIVV